MQIQINSTAWTWTFDRKGFLLTSITYDSSF